MDTNQQQEMPNPNTQETPNTQGAQSAPEMQIITVSREYGSGGGEIATRLATRLGWKLVDHEIVAQVAAELGITHEEAERRDERIESLVWRLIASMQNVEPSVLAAPDARPPIDERTYAEALNRVVAAAASEGHVVIVGRCGQAILHARRDALHLRVVAPLEPRIAYVAAREGLDRAAAERRIQQKDQNRRQYIQSLYHERSDDAHLYDLTLNTGVLDLDSCVDLAVLALERKASRLTVSSDALGPGAGLAKYPGRPGDLPYPTPPR